MERSEFRLAVFTRDGFRCVLCDKPAQDAHHLIERRLWDDGGYHLDNGVSLCGPCHWEAERTTYSVEHLRIAAGISKIALPPHMDRDVKWDKWGNVCLNDGTRVPGELFYDESVQKILGEGGVYHLFRKWVKYPRTPHLPWSPGATEDDVFMDTSYLFGRDVVVTEKMDGENTTWMRDRMYARSPDGLSHPSQGWVRRMHAERAHEIPEGYRVCGENLYAVHSLPYAKLDSYFQVFSVWDDRNVCLSWDETEEWAELLELLTVPVLWRGKYEDMDIKINPKKVEGYVVRVAEEFSYRHFRHAVGKFVRKGHITEARHHWRAKQVVPNGLRGAR